MLTIDTHAHLNFKDFNKDRDEVINRSLKEGVFMINVGSDYETSKLAVEIAQKYEKGVYASVALHPIHVKAISNLKSQNSKLQLKTESLKIEEFNYGKFESLAMSSKKVVAIGETGLDAMYPNPNQEQVFLQHLQLARELDLPAILHCRKAHSDLLQILNETMEQWNNKLKGVLHCFTGRWSEAKQYLALELYLGFNGIIYKMDLAEVIKKTPLERILIETDCPYLTPPSVIRQNLYSNSCQLTSQNSCQFASSRNEPSFVKYIAQTIAEIKGEPIEKIVEATFQNAKKLFNIKDVKD